MNTNLITKITIGTCLIISFTLFLVNFRSVSAQTISPTPASIPNEYIELYDGLNSTINLLGDHIELRQEDMDRIANLENSNNLSDLESELSDLSTEQANIANELNSLNFESNNIESDINSIKDLIDKLIIKIELTNERHEETILADIEEFYLNNYKESLVELYSLEDKYEFDNEISNSIQDLADEVDEEVQNVEDDSTKSNWEDLNDAFTELYETIRQHIRKYKLSV